jgi:hypothetical protein
VSPFAFPSDYGSEEMRDQRAPTLADRVAEMYPDCIPFVSDAALRRIAREHPEEFAEARAAVAARHEIAIARTAAAGDWMCFGVMFRLPEDVEYLALAVAHLRDEKGEEVVLKSRPGEPLVIHVWHRPLTPALARIALTQYAQDIGCYTPDAVDGYREALGLDDGEVA